MSDKLRVALEELGHLFRRELPPGRFIHLFEQKHSEELEIKVYETLTDEGYTWSGEKWLNQTPKIKQIPNWISSLIQEFEKDLKDPIKIDFIHAPPAAHSFWLFGSYFSSMEAFIEAEINDRSEYLANLFEGDISDREEHEIANEYSIWASYRDSATEFHSVLRSSLFVHLCSHVESYLVNEYRKMFKKKAPQREIIKNCAKELIPNGLVEKIPEYKNILDFVKVRNCIVHNQSILKDSNKQYFQEYSKKNEGFVLVDFKSPINDVQTKKIVLEKAFCLNALDKMEYFLKRVHFILWELREK